MNKFTQLILNCTKHRRFTIAIVLLVFILAFAAAVRYALQSSIGRDVTQLPLPTLTCKDQSIAWHGLVAGRSTRQEVLHQLGDPDEDQIVQRLDIKAQMYAYDVDSPLLLQFPEVKHRIYFRNDDVIDWMEIIVADTDGTWHPIRDFAERVGYDFDLAYSNNNAEYGFIDVQGLPEKIYVWSECGIVLNAFPHCIEDPIKILDCKSGYEQEIDTMFTRRQFLEGIVPSVLRKPNGNDIVMTKFLFPPTTYQGFGTYYGKVIPFDTWYYYWYPDMPRAPDTSFGVLPPESV